MFVKMPLSSGVYFAANTQIVFRSIDFSVSFIVSFRMAEFPVDDIEVRLVHRDQLTVELPVPSNLSGFVNFFLMEGVKLGV